MLLRVGLRLGFSVVSDAERYPGGNGITSGSMSYWVRVTEKQGESLALQRGDEADMIQNKPHNDD